jgi:hypothetical protein
MRAACGAVAPTSAPRTPESRQAASRTRHPSAGAREARAARGSAAPASRRAASRRRRPLTNASRLRQNHARRASPPPCACADGERQAQARERPRRERTPPQTPRATRSEQASTQQVIGSRERQTQVHALAELQRCAAQSPARGGSQRREPSARSPRRRRPRKRPPPRWQRTPHPSPAHGATAPEHARAQQPMPHRLLQRYTPSRRRAASRRHHRRQR